MTDAETPAPRYGAIVTALMRLQSDDVIAMEFLVLREVISWVFSELMVLFAQRRLGGEVVPVAEGDGVDEHIARAVDNVRRGIALVCGRYPSWEYGDRMRRAVESSEMFCVAVALSCDDIAERRERTRRRERARRAVLERRRP